MGVTIPPLQNGCKAPSRGILDLAWVEVTGQIEDSGNGVGMLWGAPALQGEASAKEHAAGKGRAESL